MSKALTEKQREELARYEMPTLIRQNWKRAKNGHVAAALARLGLLERSDFSERGLHDDRRLYWWEYRLTEAGRQMAITKSLIAKDQTNE